MQAVCTQGCAAVHIMLPHQQRSCWERLLHSQLLRPVNILAVKAYLEPTGSQGRYTQRLPLHSSCLKPLRQLLYLEADSGRNSGRG